MEDTINSLLSASSSPAAIEQIQDIMDELVLTVMGTNDPLNISTDIHRIVASMGADLLLYERHQVISFFLRSNFTNNDITLYYMLSFHSYVSIASHSFHFSFSGIPFSIPSLL